MCMRLSFLLNLYFYLKSSSLNSIIRSYVVININMKASNCPNCSTGSDCQSDLSMRSSAAIMASRGCIAQYSLSAYRSAVGAET